MRSSIDDVVRTNQVSQPTTTIEEELPNGSLSVGNQALHVRPLASNDNINTSLSPAPLLVPHQQGHQPQNNEVAQQPNDNQNNAPAPLNQQQIVPLNLDIRSERSGWNKFGQVVLGSLGALFGAVGGGAAGTAAGGSAGAVAGAVAGIPSGPGAVGTALAGAGVGGIVGGVAGVGVGTLAGWKAGTKLADKIADSVNGGHMQALHLHQATASVQNNRGRAFDQAEVGNLNAVTDRQWRKLLHVPNKKIWPFRSDKQVGNKADRQKIREGLVQFVAKHGVQGADHYKKLLVAAANSSNANALDNEIARLDRSQISPLNVNHQNGQTHLKRLMTGNDLKGVLGTRDPDGTVTAKKEVKTNFVGMVRNTHYKGILDGLDSYQRKLAATGLGQSDKDRFQQGADLRKDLIDLENKVDDYASRHSDRANAMNALKQQIRQERRLIDNVVAHGGGFDEQIQGQETISAGGLNPAINFDQPMTWANTTSLMAQRAGIGGRTTDNEQRLQHGGGFASGAINTVDLVEYRDGSTMVFKADKLAEGDFTGYQLDRAGVDLNNPRTGARNVATDIVARHLGLSDLIPPTEFAEHNGKIGTVSALAPGISVSHHSSTFVLEDQNQARNLHPAEQQQTGISEKRDLIVKRGGQITEDSELNQLGQLSVGQLGQLGIEKRGDDYFRLDQVVTDPVEKRKLATMDDNALANAGFRKIERAFVQTKKVTPDIDIDSGSVRHNLSDAMWLDAATFQTDRHAGNMFADFNNDGSFKGLTLIDNDQAFGKNGQGSQLFYHEHPDPQPLRIAFQANALPHVSRQMKDRLDNVNIANLRRDLSGLLSNEEIDATVDRIKNLQKHANRLADQDKVLDDNDWGTDKGNFPDRGHNYKHNVLMAIGNRPDKLPPQLIVQNEARLKAPN